MKYTAFPIWRALEEGREYQGTLSAEAFPRLLEAVKAIETTVDFELKADIDQQQQKAIIGKASVTLTLICQRCLEGFPLAFIVPIHWVPVRSEEAALEVGDDDVALLIADEVVNVIELIEDELLLALPLVPQHLETQKCEGRVYLEQQVFIQEEKVHPFAALSKLLKQ